MHKEIKKFSSSTNLLFIVHTKCRNNNSYTLNRMIEPNLIWFCVRRLRRHRKKKDRKRGRVEYYEEEWEMKFTTNNVISIEFSFAILLHHNHLAFPVRIFYINQTFFFQPPLKVLYIRMVHKYLQISHSIEQYGPNNTFFYP